METGVIGNLGKNAIMGGGLEKDVVTTHHLVVEVNHAVGLHFRKKIVLQVIFTQYANIGLLTSTMHSWVS